MLGGITHRAEDYAGAGKTRHMKMQEAWWSAQGGVQQFLAAQLLEVREREQQRIATDLHDVLGQSLTMIKFTVDESMMLLAANEAGEATESLQRLKLRVKDAIGELRHVAMNLRPPMLDDLGILATLSWFFREFETVCRDMKIEKHFNLREDSIPASLRISIFRIVQEAINNIVKHAHASCIQVSLKRTGDTLHLSIEDDGEGFDPASHSMGIGLLSMKERAEISGGRYVINSALNRGTKINVSWQFDKLEMGSKTGRRLGLATV